MTTQLQPILKPDKVPPANEGHVSALSADERLLRKAVGRCLKAQISEVLGKVENGAKAKAVPDKTTQWDQAVMREVRPIWFGLFKKGGDKALTEIRRFPKHARKMAVLSWAEMEASERVGVVVKGGPGSGNFGHEGRPGEVGGSGAGGGSISSPIVSSGISQADQDKIISEAITKIDDSDGYEYGFRLLPTALENAAVGDKLAPSFRWEDGKNTEENLTGVSTIGIRNSDKTREALSTLVKNNYFGRKVALVRGIGEGSGEDVGERILSDAEVVAVWDVGKKEETKSLKADKLPTSVVIPPWIEDSDVLDALEREMFKFAHGIDQTTADALRDELMDGMENGETISQLANRISELSDEWVEGWRSEMIARTETARAFSTGHIEAWRSTGVVSRKVWVAAGDACPFCQEMDGTVVELDENFFDQGDEQTADWRGQEIAMGHDYSDVNGPPLHPNCRCVLVAMLDET